MAGRCQIRVGRIHYVNNKQVYPEFPGYTPIVCLTKSSPYGDLGPYVLRDEYGRIMENIWQFSKVYPWVPQVSVPYTKRQPRIVWEYHQEVHVINQRGEVFSGGMPQGTSSDSLSVVQSSTVSDQEIPKLLPAYMNWRSRGMFNPDPVRYPVGNTEHKKLCICCITDDGRALGVTDARREIYMNTYCRLVKKEPKFLELYNRLRQGENLLILETDGPHEESLKYYQEKYHVPDTFIQNHTMLYTKENVCVMLYDTRHSFGHGYCLAAALAGDA